MTTKPHQIRSGSTPSRPVPRTAGPTSKLLATAAASLLMLGTSLDVQALALGAVSVQSALGEPLRAEVEIPQISSEEASTLKAQVGSPQAFQAAGMEYSAALAGARISLHRRSNGQAFLRVLGSEPIHEPFVSLVIEASWASGNLMRDYTMLLDPPGRAAPTAVLAPTPPAPAEPVTPPRVGMAEQVTSPDAATTRPTPSTRPAPSRGAAPATRGGGSTVTIKRGDTAGAIARAHAAADVSLDQMLIAMLEANPSAFIRGNVNLIKAGAVIQMPTAEQALATSATEARRMVVAQTRDFQAYRQSLAQKAQAAKPAPEATRTAGGAIEAEVRDRAAPAPTEDRLTISKAGTEDASETTAAATAAVESETAQTREQQEQAERVAELDRNLAELAELEQRTDLAPQDGPADSAAADDSALPGIEVATGAVTVAEADASSDTQTPTSEPADTAEPPATAEEATSATAPASSDPETDAAAPADEAEAASTDSETSEETAGEPVAVADEAPAAEAAPEPEPEPVAAPRPAPAPVPVAEPSFLDTLKENPLLPAAGAGLIALLAGLGFYRSRQRRRYDDSQLPSAFDESGQPDSFFGASGGQVIDTRDQTSSGLGNTSMAYSPSQLDAAGDVDPVAEADVYLAYGRDIQAEDILKEAMLTHPGRPSIHRKLAEIYARRGDKSALQELASEARDLTQGSGPEWQAIASLGQEVDPDNPLYKGASAAGAGQRMAAAAGAAAAAKVASDIGETRPPAHGDFGADTQPQMLQDPQVLQDLDSDLGAAESRPRALDSGPGALDSASAPLDLSLDLSTVLSAPAPLGGPISHSAPAAATPASVPADSGFVDLDLGMDFDPPSELSPAKPQAADTGHSPSSSGLIDFDMDALSIDPNSRSGADMDTEHPDDEDDNPLTTKLALAQEFHSIGDTEGARDLAREVVSEATGALKMRAERFLEDLG